MTRNHRIQGHGVATHKGVDVRATETHIVELQQYFALGETLSHLDHLILQGRVRRDDSGEHPRYYLI